MPSLDMTSIRVLSELPNRKARESKKTLGRRMSKVLAAAAAAALAAGALAPVALAQQSLLYEGSQGPQVSRVQRALGETQTGFFGPHTRADVTSFQQSHALIVDGIVGPQTRGALFGSGASSTSHTPTQNHQSQSSSGSSGSSVPSSIVQCESGGNYSAVNSSSGAGGAYQIMPSTWHAYGGSGLPQNASKAEQDAIASKIYQSQGSAPWSCAK